MSDTSEIKALLYKILSESPSQYGFVDFIKSCTLLNDVESDVAQQLMEAFIAKYSQYDRYIFYFSYYKPWGSQPSKVTKKESDFCLDVIDKMLSIEKNTLCIQSNGNILYSYLIWRLAENDKRSKELLEMGAHTLSEQRHFYLFSAIGPRITKETFMNCFMRNFKKNVLKPSSIFIAFSMLKDNEKNPNFEKYCTAIKSKIQKICSLDFEGYEAEVFNILKSNLNQIKKSEAGEVKELSKKEGWGNILLSLSQMKKSTDSKGTRKKVAVLISGQFRDDVVTEGCANFIDIIRKNFDADVYVSTWDSIGVSSFRFGECREYDKSVADSIKKAVKKSPISDSDFAKLYQDAHPRQISKDKIAKSLGFDNFVMDVESDQISKALGNNQERLFYKIERVFHMTAHKKYDVYIRLRPDLKFNPQFDVCELIKKIESDAMYLRSITFLGEQGVRVDDNFAIAGADAIRAYASVYSLSKGVPFKLHGFTRLGQSIAAHKSLAYTLLFNRINIHTCLSFDAWSFATRSDRVSKEQLMSKIIESDISHGETGFSRALKIELGMS